MNPENGLYYYCGVKPATKTPLQNASTGFSTTFPYVAGNLSTKGVFIYIFRNAVEAAKYFAYPGTLDAAGQQAAYNSNVGLNGYSNVSTRVSVIFEEKGYAGGWGASSPYNNIPTSSMIRTVYHELGHQFDKSGSLWDGQQPYFGTLVNTDQVYMDKTAVAPNTAAVLRSTYSEYLAPPVGAVKWDELYAEEFAIRALQTVPSNGGALIAADTNAIVPYFSCSRAYMHAKMASGAKPVQADFDAIAPGTYARCSLIYKPPGCTIVTSSGSYPYQFTGSAATETGWYVYCGIETDGRFKTRTGNNFQSLPTSIPPEWRPKFQAGIWGLYVFRDVNQAVSLLGSAAVPASAQVDGVLGFTQPNVLGNAKAPFVAMFEQVKQSGSYVEHPNTNDLFNYDSGLWRESGRVIDKLATTVGSTSTAFQTRITGDISRFNLRNGCAASGPDSNLWGSLKSTICNTTTNVKKAPYVGVSNLAIVRGLTVAQLGSGAVKFPPDYQAMFADTPAASNYNLIWAELIGYRRAAGNRGNDFAAMDVWVNTIYVCGKAYAADGYYTNAVAPTATCP